MEEQVKSNVEEVHVAPEGMNVDMLAELRDEQNLPFGIVCTLAAAVIGAVIWAVITVVTKYQIGYMAVGLGFLVGTVNRVTGKGVDIVFGIVGAILALLGCVMGNYLSVVGLSADSFEMSYFDALTGIDSGIVWEVMKENIGFADFLFYGIAGYEGFKFSFR